MSYLELVRQREADHAWNDVPRLLLGWACYQKTRDLSCGCAYSWQCPDHSARHIGTHD